MSSLPLCLRSAGPWPAPYFPLFERSLSFRKSAHVSDRRIVAGAAAVCHDRLPGHVTGVVGSEEGDHSGDVFRLPGVIHRIVRDEQFLVLVGQRPFGRWGQHQSRRDAVASHAGFAVLRGYVPREVDRTGFADAVIAAVRLPVNPPIDATLTIAPPPLAVIQATACCVMTIMLRTITWNTSSK